MNWSSAKYIQEAAATPEPPSQPFLLDATPTSLTVSWTPPPVSKLTPAVEVYHLQIQPKWFGGKWQEHKVALKSTVALVPRLEPGNRYILRVRGKNSNGWGAWSLPSADMWTDTRAGKRPTEAESSAILTRCRTLRRASAASVARLSMQWKLQCQSCAVPLLRWMACNGTIRSSRPGGERLCRCRNFLDSRVFKIPTHPGMKVSQLHDPQELHCAFCSHTAMAHVSASVAVCDSCHAQLCHKCCSRRWELISLGPEYYDEAPTTSRDTVKAGQQITVCRGCDKNLFGYTMARGRKKPQRRVRSAVPGWNSRRAQGGGGNGGLSSVAEDGDDDNAPPAEKKSTEDTETQFSLPPHLEPPPNLFWSPVLLRDQPKPADDVHSTGDIPTLVRARSISHAPSARSEKLKDLQQRQVTEKVVAGRARLQASLRRCHSLVAYLAQLRRMREALKDEHMTVSPQVEAMLSESGNGTPFAIPPSIKELVAGVPGAPPPMHITLGSTIGKWKGYTELPAALTAFKPGSWAKWLDRVFEFERAKESPGRLLPDSPSEPKALQRSYLLWDFEHWLAQRAINQKTGVETPAPEPEEHKGIDSGGRPRKAATPKLTDEGSRMMEILNAACGSQAMKDILREPGIEVHIDSLACPLTGAVWLPSSREPPPPSIQPFLRWFTASGEPLENAPWTPVTGQRRKKKKIKKTRRKEASGSEERKEGDTKDEENTEISTDFPYSRLHTLGNEANVLKFCGVLHEILSMVASARIAAAQPFVRASQHFVPNASDSDEEEEVEEVFLGSGSIAVDTVEGSTSMASPDLLFQGTDAHEDRRIIALRVAEGVISLIASFSRTIAGGDAHLLTHEALCLSPHVRFILRHVQPHDWNVSDLNPADVQAPLSLRIGVNGDASLLAVDSSDLFQLWHEMQLDTPETQVWALTHTTMRHLLTVNIAHHESASSADSDPSPDAASSGAGSGGGGGGSPLPTSEILSEFSGPEPPKLQVEEEMTPAPVSCIVPFFRTFERTLSLSTVGRRSGSLDIAVIGAKDLRIDERLATLSLRSGSESSQRSRKVYSILRLGKLEAQSKPKDMDKTGGVNEWGERFSLEWDGKDVLSVAIWRVRRDGTEDCVGSAPVSLFHLKPGQPKRMWVELSTAPLAVGEEEAVFRATRRGPVSTPALDVGGGGGATLQAVDGRTTGKVQLELYYWPIPVRAHRPRNKELIARHAAERREVEQSKLTGRG